MSDRRRNSRTFYNRIKQPSIYNQTEIGRLFSQVREERVIQLGDSLSSYLGINLPETVSRREDLQDYKTNPYVLLTSANVMNWDDVDSFAAFLFNSKLYAGLETSFGKSIESQFMPFYPTPESPWIDPPEKIAESQMVRGIPNEEKARARDISVWREIDKSYIQDNKRYIISIKSGPHCINDTQVESMKNAISEHCLEWYEETKNNNPEVNSLDIVIGITYGTEKTTNNKENQILIKLLEHGFIDSGDSRGTLYYEDIPQIKVYRVIGKDFWSLIGNPQNPDSAQHTFLEILLGLLNALKHKDVKTSLEETVNKKIRSLSKAIEQLILPRKALPEWLRTKYDKNELLWLMSAISTFYDEGMPTLDTYI